MSTQQADVLSEPIEFPCGRRAPNRLVKAPLEEMLADFGGGLPNERIYTLYRQWAKGGWGMIITGNVAIDSTHLGSPFDVVIPAEGHQKEQVIDSFTRYALAVKGRQQRESDGKQPLAVVQLVHAGRQSMRGSGRAPWRSPLAPSSIPMSTSSSIVGRAIDFLLWNTPKAMTKKQIAWLIDTFANAATLCQKAGFDGVEIHASHGYQIAAFLSPRTNTRTDEYGGSSENRARLLLDVIKAVRQRVPGDFVVGVKLNSSDYVEGGLTEDDALLNVEMLADNGGVDFVEISGGNYENPSFMMDNFDAESELARISARGKAGKKVIAPKKSSRTDAREAFFQAFAERAHSAIDKSNSKMKVILTGGLRTRAGMASPILKGTVDGVALGRLACVYPEAPHLLLDSSITDNSKECSPAPYVMKGSEGVAWLPLKLVNAGWTTIWHAAMLSYLARGQRPKIDAGVGEVFVSIFAPWSLRYAAYIPLLIGFGVMAITTLMTKVISVNVW